MYLEVQSGKEMDFKWGPVLNIWAMYLLYLVAFIIHNYFIAPLLVYKKKAGRYFLFAGLLIAVFFFGEYYMRPDQPRHGPRDKTERSESHMQQRKEDSTALMMVLSHSKDSTAIAKSQKIVSRRHHHPGPPPMFEFLDFLGSIMLFLILGLNIGVKLYLKQEKDEKNHSELEQRHLQEQLAYLRYQINPHFFMNTLNNIHALIDIDPEKAKSTIVRLSRLMRYMLYESNHILVPLSRELMFLNHYIALMKMRYSEKVVITVDFPEAMPDCMVPPLLYVTFVENAFKHGVTYEQECFIYIELIVDGERVVFHCTNSKPTLIPKQGKKKQGGVGLSNVHRRLKLIYGDDYTLDINDTQDQYDVKLSLPLHPKREKELMPEDTEKPQNGKQFKA
jgi:hypothetical protein